jgi:hypothetical protein
MSLSRSAHYPRLDNVEAVAFASPDVLVSASDDAASQLADLAKDLLLVLEQRQCRNFGRDRLDRLHRSNPTRRSPAGAVRLGRCRGGLLCSLSGERSCLVRSRLWAALAVFTVRC